MSPSVFNEPATVTLLYGESRFQRLLRRVGRGAQRVSSGIVSVRSFLDEPEPAAVVPEPVQKMPAINLGQFMLPAMMVGGVLLIRFMKRKDRGRRKGRR